MRHELTEMQLDGPAADAAIDELRSKFRIPSDYLDFLKTHNGGHGLVGRVPLVLFRAEQIQEINDAARIGEFAPGLLIFASDGSGKSFAFDFRESKVKLVEFFDMDLGDEEPVEVATTFDGFIDALFGERG